MLVFCTTGPDSTATPEALDTTRTALTVVILNFSIVYVCLFKCYYAQWQVDKKDKTPQITQATPKSPKLLLDYSYSHWNLEVSSARVRVLYNAACVVIDGRPLSKKNAHSSRNRCCAGAAKP